MVFVVRRTKRIVGVLTSEQDVTRQAVLRRPFFTDRLHVPLRLFLRRTHVTRCSPHLSLKSTLKDIDSDLTESCTTCVSLTS